MQSCADPSFGINPQALAILHLLSQYTPDFAEWDDLTKQWKVEIFTFPWFNGLEKGVALVVRKDSTYPDHLVIAFGEDRTTDRVFVQQWMSDTSIPNGPNLQDMTNRSLSSRALFPAMDYAKVLDHIVSAMRRFYEFQSGVRV